MTKKQSVSGCLISLFTAAFALLFGGIAILTLLCKERLIEDTWYFFSPIQTAAFAAGWAVVLLLPVMILRGKTLTKRQENTFAALLLAVLAVGGGAVGWLLEVESAWDVEAVYRGAISLCETGGLGEYLSYFYKYGNNVGGTAYLSLWFRLTTWLGAYSLRALVLNVLSLVLTASAVWRLARKIGGAKGGLFALWMMVLCVPMYVYCAVFYTDTLAMPYVVGSSLLYIKGTETENFPRRMAAWLGCGVLLGMGMNVKMSVTVMLVAFVLHGLFALDFRRWAALGAVLLLCAGVCLGAAKLEKDRLLPDKQRISEESLPVSSWIMMGMTGDGRYYSDDVAYIQSFRNKDAGSAAAWAEIKNRVKNYGISGMLNLWKQKTEYSFTDGTFNVASMLDDGIVRPNLLHDYVLLNTDGFMLFYKLCTGYYLVLLILAAINAAKDTVYRRGRGVANTASLTRLGFFGIWCFLMLWESNSRYVIHFLPLLILAGVWNFKSDINFSKK